MDGFRTNFLSIRKKHKQDNCNSFAIPLKVVIAFLWFSVNYETCYFWNIIPRIVFKTYDNNLPYLYSNKKNFYKIGIHLHEVMYNEIIVYVHLTPWGLSNRLEEEIFYFVTLCEFQLTWFFNHKSLTLMFFYLKCKIIHLGSSK